MSSASIDNLIMKGVGKLSLGHAWLRSWKSVHTRMVPCFLLTGIGLETHDVYAMGYMNPMTIIYRSLL
jgi:hypothetical protein